MEEDLIIKYLQKRGSKVLDSFYHHETLYSLSSDVKTLYLGDSIGVPNDKCYFFGNISIFSKIQGTVVLTNVNQLDFSLVTRFPLFVSTNLLVRSSPAQDMKLEADGTYQNFKRMYGLGFNEGSFAYNSMGAALGFITVQCNGILYILQ
jgi:hypothetical protein